MNVRFCFSRTGRETCECIHHNTGGQVFAPPQQDAATGGSNEEQIGTFTDVE